MKWANRVGRLVSVGLAASALGGGLLAASRWAESRALATVLGSGAQASAIKVHWSQSAGCAEDITIPLTASDDPHFRTARLTADRMWFTYDLSSLLRKRLIVPRVLIEDAVLDVGTYWSALAPAAAGSFASAPNQPQTTEDASRAPSEPWARLHGMLESLENDEFIGGTQVAVDTAMLSEQWRAEFAGVHQRARRILSEAQDIQQQLSSMDNVLRREGQVVASRDRLEVLKTTLVAMKTELARTERTLRDQQSRVREALLIEKNALHDQGVAFRAPSAAPVAAKAVELWIAECLRQPVRFGRLVGELINKPYTVTPVGRGENVRFAAQDAADFAVASAKISGEIVAEGRRSPFTATGSFQLLPTTNVAHGRSEIQPARWQMSVGGPAECVSLEGHSVDTRCGRTHVSLQSSAAGHIDAECELSRSDMRGAGRLQLRQWLEQNASSRGAHVARAFKQDSWIAELVERSLSELERAPESVEFRFSGPSASPRLEIDDQASRWLADGLELLVCQRVSAGYDAAAEKLDARIRRDLDSLNRSVALGRNEAFQYINQQLEELRMVEASVDKNLQQRSPAHFARQPHDEVMK